MARPIDQECFSDEDYERFARCVQQNLAALRLVLARPGFGEGEPTLGAELELCIVDRLGRALGVNRDILAAHVDKRLTLELNRFNLEYNLTPVSARGTPFMALEGELTAALASLNTTAQRFGGRVVAIGILPTLTPDDVAQHALTDFPRYRALSAGLRRLRQSPFSVRIDGADPLSMRGDDITLEGANTSFQLHLRVPPRQFADIYNAAQLATPLALAISGNSPIFCGHRLWEETRVALFKQALDVREMEEGRWRPPARVSFGHGWVREGAFELFAESAALFPPILPVCSDEDALAIAESGGLPRLDELRVQQGTVWRWNRAIYDPGHGGHLRIEFRALPAGPTPVDMMASAAFLLGLTIALRAHVGGLLPAFPFTACEWNFYRAAQLGMQTDLLWPCESAPSPRLVPARRLVERLLPQAASGLAELGVSDAETQRLLGVIHARVALGATGARWQRRTYDTLRTSMGRPQALAYLMERYIARSATGAPVHAWDVPTPGVVPS